MHRFIHGEERMQQALLPHSLEDYVSEENPVRAIEVFINELDLAALGFSGMTPAATGRPAYHPSTLLKIYLYGYLNHVQSSRRLEREAQRNIELMWLVERLAPDFKTIADFRRQRRGDPSNLPVICDVMSPARADRWCNGGGRWQPVQGGQHPRQELYAGSNPSANGPGGRQHCAVSGDARHR